MNMQDTAKGATPDDADAMVAMAYVDGELDAQARAGFEERMRSDPALARAVAEHRALNVLARRTAPLEPADVEWGRLRLSPWYRSSRVLGWALLVIGTLASLAWTVWAVATNESLDVSTRVLILGSLLGFLLLFLTVLVRRLRTYELDPYLHVER